jgi:uncharacterized protein YjbJ (UPF0337 family)
MMKPSTQDKTAGKLHEFKGAVRQRTGEIMRDPKLTAEGKAEKNAGKMQSFAGKIEKSVGK